MITACPEPVPYTQEFRDALAGEVEGGLPEKYPNAYRAVLDDFRLREQLEAAAGARP